MESPTIEWVGEREPKSEQLETSFANNNCICHGEGSELSEGAVCMGDKNEGGGNFCSSGASEGGAEAIGANLNRPVKLDLWQQFLWQKRLQSRGGGTVSYTHLRAHET